MKKISFLYIVIAILMLLNAITITFVWRHNPPPRQPRPGFAPPPNPGDFIIRELSFDKEQRKSFDVLRDEHRNGMNENRDAVRQCRDQLYGLFAKDDTKHAEALAEQIGALEKEKELITFKYFQKIRVLCNDKQKERFDRIVQQILQIMKTGSPPRPSQERKR